MNYLKMVQCANTKHPIISHHLIFCTVEGKRTAWEAKKITHDVAEAMLGADEFYIIQCGIEQYPKRYLNHSILVTQKAMDALAIEERNTLVSEAGVTMLDIFGPCIIGPTWCFEDLEEVQEGKPA